MFLASCENVVDISQLLMFLELFKTDIVAHILWRQLTTSKGTRKHMLKYVFGNIYHAIDTYTTVWTKPPT